MADEGQLFAEVLEKMIELQVRHTEDLTLIKRDASETKKIQSEIQDQVKQTCDHMFDEFSKVNSHFSNGFRSEIKKHVSDKLSPINDRMETIEGDIGKIKDTLTKPWFWVKLIGGITSGLIAVVLILGQVTIKILEYLAQSGTN